MVFTPSNVHSNLWSLAQTNVSQICYYMNHRLPFYVSSLPDVHVLNIYALNILWEVLDGYAFCLVALIKHPVRDACYLYIGGNQAPLAPHFIFLITLWPFGGFFSNLAGVCSSPGEFCGICCSDILTNQRGHMTKNVFCPDDNLKGILSIHLKLGILHSFN